ncbi:complexin 1 [Rhinolophus ferrumequinum]|uniref:Complexin-1 n=1 Tax=Rhinolophus ferrumequinum TaxID=59479 RepID=A0A7J7ZBV8_RHIFE|nr:complexin 1 [Rhinolophus ferrumequinum]
MEFVMKQALGGATKDMGKMLGGDEEKDPDAAKKEEERQEALRQEEEERKAKYALHRLPSSARGPGYRKGQPLDHPWVRDQCVGARLSGPKLRSTAIVGVLGGASSWCPGPHPWGKVGSRSPPAQPGPQSPPPVLTPGCWISASSCRLPTSLHPEPVIFTVPVSLCPSFSRLGPLLWKGLLLLNAMAFFLN